MDETQRATPKEFTFKKEIGAYDRQHCTNMLLAEMANALAEHFGVKFDEGDEENDVQPSVSINFVALDRDAYDDLREIEWMYKDLCDESDPDNAHVEGDE